MSADARPYTSSAAVGGQAEALYFESGGKRLFGWLHRPDEATAANIGVVICKPFGYEAICAHRTVRAFADMGAAIGMPALRFDYLGTGDSADIAPEANQLEVWTNDVVAAVAELRRLTGVRYVCVVGFRLGGLLAALAGVRSHTIDGLVLISPIVNGRRYLRQLRTTLLAAALSAGSVQPPPSAGQSSAAAASGSLEVSGFSLSAASIAALAQMDVTTLETLPASQILIIDDNNLPLARDWQQKLSAVGAKLEYQTLPGIAGVLMTDPRSASIPEAMLETTRQWLSSLQSKPSWQVRSNTDQPLRVGLPTTMTELQLPGDAGLPQAILTERPVFLSSMAVLFGIVTEPFAGEKRRRAVILLNVGAEHHVGSNRMYVSLARQWARYGYTVLRLDLAGLGDSATRPQRPDNEVFPAAALEDINVAIEFMRTNYGASEITLGGLCSGAYHSLRAAVAGFPVNRILVVNPMNFYGAEGMTTENLQDSVDVTRNFTFYRKRLLSWSIWKRIITGHFNIWRIARIVIRRPLLTVESGLRDLARGLRIHLPRDLGRELEDLVARGIRVVFVFSRGEPGIDVLKIQAGSSLDRLAQDCVLHVIDSADHIFSQRATRVELERILSEELSALYIPAARSSVNQTKANKDSRGGAEQRVEINGSTQGLVLKIAYFVNHYPKVSHSFIRREILALERLGFEVQRIALHGWREALPDIEDQHERDQTRYVLKYGALALLVPTLVALLRTPLRFCSALGVAVRMARESDRTFPYHLAYIAEACRVLPWLVASGARHIHAHFGSNSAEVALYTHILGGPPFSFTVHGPNEFVTPMGLREKVHRSAFVVAISHYGVSQLYLRSRYEDWPKVKLVHCGLEKAFYDNASGEVSTAARLVCVGRLCEEKGQLLLIEAAARIVAKGIPLELVLAGDGPLRGEVERLIEKRGLAKLVRVTGWISSDEVRNEILAARALVLPSFAEGLPVVLMEAMALRRPVLTTYVAGIPELVRSGENGWLFPAGSVHDLTAAIEACLSMGPEDLRRIGEAGHSRVIQRHSIDTEAQKLADLFQPPVSSK
jgi:glycosyltransferase involved in cell wall biosynthesis/alpha-beta hydrolase superfamily lysophospholipase